MVDICIKVSFPFVICLYSWVTSLLWCIGFTLENFQFKTCVPDYVHNWATIFKHHFSELQRKYSSKKSFYNIHAVQKDGKVELIQEGQAWKGSGWESKELLCIDSSSIHTPTSLKRNNYYHFEKTPTCHPGLLSVSILTPRWQKLWCDQLGILCIYQKTCHPYGPKVNKFEQTGDRSVLAPNYMLLPWTACLSQLRWL